MKRLAQQTLTFGGAVAAGGIALVSAAEAWFRLQLPEGAERPLSDLAMEIGLAVVLPFVVVGLAVGLSWLTRLRRSGDVRGEPALENAAPFAEPPFDEATLPAFIARPGRARTLPRPALSKEPARRLPA